jgi:hypothetical protein
MYSAHVPWYATQPLANDACPILREKAALLRRSVLEGQFGEPRPLNFHHESHFAFRLSEWKRLARVLVGDGVDVFAIVIRTALHNATT